MPQTSSRADDRLTALAAAVEAEETGLRVIAARQAGLPYVDLQATVEILEARQFNILEAFMLRAAHGLQPVPTLVDLAAMLGLDPLFVNASWERLAEMQAVSLGDEGKPQLTSRGQDYYLQGQLPPAATEEELRLRYWAVSDQLVISDQSESHDAVPAAFPGYVVQSAAEQEAAAGRAVNELSRLVKATEEAGLDLHRPEEGQTISAVSSWQVTSRGAVACVVLVAQETLATGGDGDTLLLRVLDVARGRRHYDVEAVLRRWIAEGRVTLRDLLTGDGGIGT